MKKIIMLGLFSVILFGCSQKEQEEYQSPVESNDPLNMTATYIEDDKISKEMRNSVARVTQLLDESSKYFISLDLKNNKHIKGDMEQIKKVREMKEELDNITFRPVSEVDKAIYDTIYMYKYNLSQVMEYMIRFLYDKDQDTLDVYMSYVDDLKYDVRTFKELAEKYNIQ